MNITKGITFYEKNTTNQGLIPHLHFIISEPDQDGKVLVVNMTTLYNIPGEDHSCILDNGEYHKISKKSYIVYKRAKEINYIKLLNNKIKKLIDIDIKDRISEKVLIKIQEGAKKSPLLPKGLKKYFVYF